MCGIIWHLFAVIVQCLFILITLFCYIVYKYIYIYIYIYIYDVVLQPPGPPRMGVCTKEDYLCMLRPCAEPHKQRWLLTLNCQSFNTSHHFRSLHYTGSHRYHQIPHKMFFMFARTRFHLLSKIFQNGSCFGTYFRFNIHEIS